MSPLLIISHCLFLTREQRYALCIPEAEIEVIGYCSPMWVQDGHYKAEISEEIFARYKLRHCPEPEKHTISLIPEGFMLKLSPEMPKYLLDVPDGGCNSLNFTHKNVIIHDDKVAPILHYMSVEDMKVLEKTMVQL